MSCCGSKFKNVYKMNEHGFIEKKLDKTGKQEQVNLFQQIQDHFGEVDFKSKLEHNKEQQNNILVNLNKTGGSKFDGKIYEDINNYDFVDLLGSINKLKNNFTDENGVVDANWYKRIDQFLTERKLAYANEAKQLVNLKKSSEKKLSEKKVEKSEDKK